MNDLPAWTNPSVLQFAGAGDPLTRIVSVARQVMAAAADAGLPGPPFDPLAVAKLLGLGVHARADVNDARLGVASAATVGDRIPQPAAGMAGIIPLGSKLVVEYNPTRPRGRMRYSVAHELAHAFFADAAAAPRHRTGGGAVRGDDDSWQLEMLCNVAAAEILMPTEAVEGLASIDVDIDYFMDQRRRFDVSTEALLRRIATVSGRPLAMLSLLRVTDQVEDTLRVEYSVHSRAFVGELHRGLAMPPDAGLRITAVGQTARLTVELLGDEYRLQAVGSPAYPGRSLPRVLALLEPAEAPVSAPSGLRYVTGDVTAPGAEERPVVIVHVTNDSARAWGGRGVARVLGARFPSAKGAYHKWAVAQGGPELASVHIVETSEQPGVYVASVVAQRGFGAGSPPRLAYIALAQALTEVGERACALDARVHLPRLGTGQAGGRWDLIEAEIDECLIRRGLDVTVFTVPVPVQGS